MAKYYIDAEDELLYLQMLEDMDYLTASSIFARIKEETPATTNVTASARNTPFEELPYRVLRYIILGCKQCGAELRVKALATFIFRAGLPKPLNALVDNDHLKKALFINLQHKLPEIYKWSNCKYDEDNDK